MAVYHSCGEQLVCPLPQVFSQCKISHDLWRPDRFAIVKEVAIRGLCQVWSRTAMDRGCCCLPNQHKLINLIQSSSLPAKALSLLTNICTSKIHAGCLQMNISNAKLLPSVHHWMLHTTEIRCQSKTNSAQRISGLHKISSGNVVTRCQKRLLGIYSHAIVEMQRRGLLPEIRSSQTGQPSCHRWHWRRGEICWGWWLLLQDAQWRLQCYLSATICETKHIYKVWFSSARRTLRPLQNVLQRSIITVRNF